MEGDRGKHGRQKYITKVKWESHEIMRNASMPVLKGRERAHVRWEDCINRDLRKTGKTTCQEGTLRNRGIRKAVEDRMSDGKTALRGT